MVQHDMLCTSNLAKALSCRYLPTNINHSMWMLIVDNRCLTLILLEPKVINLCHQYRARPACMDYTVGWQTSCSHLDIPKMIMGIMVIGWLKFLEDGHALKLKNSLYLNCDVVNYNKLNVLLGVSKIIMIYWGSCNSGFVKRYMLPKVWIPVLT